MFFWALVHTEGRSGASFGRPDLEGSMFWAKFLDFARKVINMYIIYDGVV